MRNFELSTKKSMTGLLATVFLATFHLHAAEFTPADPIPVPAPAPALTWEKDIQPIVSDNCSSCHSGDKPSGNLALLTQADVLKVKTTITSVVTKGTMPEGDPTWKDSVDGKKLLAWLLAQEPTWEKNIKLIVADNCQRCHTKGNAKKGIILDLEADLVKYRSSVTRAVTYGSMPPGNRTWKNTPEGKILLDWLKAI